MTFEVNDHIHETLFANLTMSPPPLSTGQLFGYGFPMSRQGEQHPPERPEHDSLTIDGTGSELIIQGPGKFGLKANCQTDAIMGDISNTNALVQIALQPVDFDRSIRLKVNLKWKALNPEDTRYRIGQWVANN